MANAYSYAYGDSFTDTNGVLLSAHEPDSETPFSWSRVDGAEGYDIIIQDNKLWIDEAISFSVKYEAVGLTPTEVSTGVFAIEFDVDWDAEAAADPDNGGDGQITAVIGTGNGAEGYEVTILNFGDELEIDVGRKNSADVTQNFDFGSSEVVATGIHTVRLEVDTVNNVVTGYLNGVAKASMSDSTLSSFTKLFIWQAAGTPNPENPHTLQMTSFGTPFIDLGEIHLDRQFTTSAGSYAAAEETVFQDTFTGSNDTQMVAHTPDTAPTGAYQEDGSTSPFNGYYARISSNKLKDTGGTSAARLLWHSGAITQHNGGVEAYIDADHDNAGGSAWHVGFMVLVKGESPVTEAYIVYTNRVDDDNITVGASAVAGDAAALTSSSIALANGTGIRLGCTIQDDQTIDVWTEPYGGGTRTQRGTYTPTPNYWDSTHNKVGLYRNGTPGVQGFIGDNFTVVTINPDPGTTWTLPYAVAVDGSEGEVVVVRNDTGEILTTTRPSTTTVMVADEDLSGVSVTIGIAYEFRYTFSTLYPRSREGQADTRGRLQLRNGRLRYSRSVQFNVEVTPEGRAVRTVPFAASEIESGNFRFPIITRNEGTTIEVVNSSPFPCIITGLDWEGLLVNRSRRI